MREFFLGALVEVCLQGRRLFLVSGDVSLGVRFAVTWYGF